MYSAASVFLGFLIKIRNPFTEPDNIYFTCILRNAVLQSFRDLSWLDCSWLKNRPIFSWPTLSCFKEAFRNVLTCGSWFRYLVMIWISHTKWHCHDNTLICFLANSKRGKTIAVDFSFSRFDRKFNPQISYK